MEHLKIDLQEQIEHEAIDDGDLWSIRLYGEIATSSYRKGALKYALKWQQAEQRIAQLEQWKKEAILLLDPLLDWGHAQKDIPLGSSVTTEILRRAKLYTKAEEMMERMANLLNQAIIPVYQGGTKEAGALVRAIKKELNEYNTYKKQSNDPVDG